MWQVLQGIAHALAISLPLMATFLLYKLFAFRISIMDEDGLSALYKNRFSAGELPRKNAIWKVLCQHISSSLLVPTIR